MGEKSGVQSQGSVFVILLMVMLGASYCDQSKKCKLNDSVRFRNYNFEKIDDDLKVWKNE